MGQRWCNDDNRIDPMIPSWSQNESRSNSQVRLMDAMGGNKKPPREGEADQNDRGENQPSGAGLHALNQKVEVRARNGCIVA